MPLLISTQLSKVYNKKRNLDGESIVGAPSDETSRNSTLVTKDAHSVSGPMNHRAIESYPTRNTEKKIRKNFFPHKLMEMLSSPYFADCITWKCDGKAFFISDPDKFAEKNAVYHSQKGKPRKESFARKLNRWGFRMELSKGPNCGTYSHPLFRKDKPWLCEMMGCEKNTTSSKAKADPQVEESQEAPLKKRKLSCEKELDSVTDEINSNDEASSKEQPSNESKVSSGEVCDFDQNSNAQHESNEQSFSSNTLSVGESPLESTEYCRPNLLRDLWFRGKRSVDSSVSSPQPQDSLVNIHNAIVKNAVLAMLANGYGYAAHL